MQILNNYQKLSWKKINLFLQCKRCFYKEQVLQKKSPFLDPDCFSINNAVDHLWKKEFDQYRQQNKPHPIMIQNKINGVPYMHNLIDIWRDYRAGGICISDEVNKLELTGVIDDVWINSQDELIIVDYKTSAKHTYRYQNKWSLNNIRQISFYANLFKKMGYKISSTGYFLYSIACKDKPFFNKVLEFETAIQPCIIDDSWINPSLKNINKLLEEKIIPKPAINCDFCKYDL